MALIRGCLILSIVVVYGGRGKLAGSLSSPDVINRLPRDLIPFHYDLSIRPDISSSPPFPSSGNVTIYLECFKDTNVLILNTFRLDIDLKSVKIAAGPLNSQPTPDPEFSSFAEFPEKEESHFKVKNKFKKNFKYVFQVSFSGKLRETGQDGLYWDSYVGLDGSIKYIVATQLESIDARKMFPCLDEVDMKSTFNISVQRSKGHVVISNMPNIKSVALSNGWIEDYFETTPVMSTYLVCIVVGDFKRVVAPTPPGTNITISLYATEVQVQNLEYMRNFAVTRLQKWFDDSTGYPYREPKMDHVALPNKSGAMENWGIITYGEEILCVHKETTSIVGKFNGVTIVSHELAHMWYGNLLTCKWWDELWIQEGFATHYNYNPTDILGWEWMQTQQSDARRGVQSFMSLDQKNTTNTVRMHIKSPQHSESAFTSSTYNKGGAIVRSLQGILTQPTLNNALAKYLKKHAYKNVGAQDLAESLNEQASLDGITYPNKSPLDFNKILDPWLNQIGYPLVTVERLNQSHVEASQIYYLHPYNQVVFQPSKFNYQWEIPITKVTKLSPTSDWDKTPTDWIHVNETSKILPLSNSLRNWYIINPRQYFFYRVLYDYENRKNLVEQLVYNHEAIPPETRSQLIDDNFDLARNLYLPVIEALDFTEYLSSELTYNPWAATLKHYHFLAPLFQQEDYYPQLQAYFRRKLDKVLDNIGYGFYQHESVLESYLRKDAISAACSLGSKMCLTLVRSLFLNYIINPEINSVNPNILPTALCQGISEGSELDWADIYNQYDDRKYSQVKDERYAYILALTCTENTKLLDRLFNDIINGRTFISKDINQATLYLANTKHGADILWTHMDENWKQIKNRLSVVETITNKWYTLKQLKKLQSFINNRTNLTSSERDSLTQNLLQVELNMEFYEHNSPQIKDWINIRQPADDTSKGYTDNLNKVSPAQSAHLHWNLLQDIYNNEMIGRRYFE